MLILSLYFLLSSVFAFYLCVLGHLIRLGVCVNDGRNTVCILGSPLYEDSVFFIIVSPEHGTLPGI